MKTDIYMEKFDSRNTSVRYDTPALSKRDMSKLGKELSTRDEYHHITAHYGVDFETFERGELVEWSYPNGLGQIKANS